VERARNDASDACALERSALWFFASPALSSDPAAFLRKQSATPAHAPERRRVRLRGVVGLPFHFLAIFTGAKSFADNPVLGSRTLNALGLHAWRLKAAHALANFRRGHLARGLPADQREAFDRDGFVVVRDLLPRDDFETLRSQLFAMALDSREQQQGDTITRRVPIGPELRRRLPILDRLLDSPGWNGLLSYVASTRSEPLYYVQTIFGGFVDGPADPQLDLHADTFHPSLKAWFFLTDVRDDDRPLTYVPGSHRLTPQRLEWEREKSLSVMSSGDRLSQRGSFRVSPAELPDLGLPQATRFCVPANTLVVADTCGFHARGDAEGRTVRVEIWAYARRTPFLPWTGFDLLSWRPVAQRRAEWFASIMDWLDRRGLAKQHWAPVGAQRPDVP